MHGGGGGAAQWSEGRARMLRLAPWVHSPRALAIGGSTRSAGGGTLEVVHYMHTSYTPTQPRQLHTL